MPSIPLFPSSQESGTTFQSSSSSNPLPTLLQTPSGLAIVEIQGTINVPSSETSDGEQQGTGITADTPVGQLAFPLYSETSDPSDKAWMKRVYLYIGKHQRMTGEVKQLAKQYAIIRRRESIDDARGHEQLEIAEIVKFKILFMSRPEPVGAEQVVP